MEQMGILNCAQNIKTFTAIRVPLMIKILALSAGIGKLKPCYLLENSLIAHPGLSIASTAQDADGRQ